MFYFLRISYAWDWFVFVFFFVYVDNSGSVTGLLKVGTKNLYVFDENGDTKTTPAMCVLDFYVHESRQRAGLGKQMFELMLEHENVVPEKLAIDRPSEKLVAFLRKHYGKLNFMFTFRLFCCKNYFT